MFLPMMALLQVILGITTQDRATDRAQQAVVLLPARVVPRESAHDRTTQSTLAFGAGGTCGGWTVRVSRVWRLVVCALLWELVRGT